MPIILQRRDGCLVVTSRGGLPCPDGAVLVEAFVPTTLHAERALMAQLAQDRFAGLVLCGVETPADIEKASALLRVVEADRSLRSPSLIILARFDTAKAALGLAAFNRAIPRLAGFLFDGAALAGAAGTSPESELVRDLRRRLPLAAKASNAAAVLIIGHGDEAPERIASDGYDGVCHCGGSEHPGGIENA